MKEEQEKNKVAFLLPDCSVGGIEKVVLTIVNHAAEEGRNVQLIVMQKRGELLKTLSPKVKILNLKCPKARYLFLYLGKYLRKEKIAVLYTVRDLVNIISILSVKTFSPKTQVVIAQHNYFYLEDQSRNWRNRIIFPFLMRNIYPLANKIIAVSYGIKDFLVDWGIDNSKIEVINNPIDINITKRKSMQEVNIPYGNFIVFVGRLSSVKNVILAMEAFSIIKEQCPDLFFLILGNGELYNNLKDEVLKKKYANRVCLLGNIVNPYPYIKKARLLLLPSFSEAFSMVVLESVILGTSVVCTPSKGPIEILGKDYKYMSSSFSDIEEYANLISQALKEKTYMYNVNLSNFDIEVVVNRYLNI